MDFELEFLKRCDFVTFILIKMKRTDINKFANKMCISIFTFYDYISMGSVTFNSL